MFNVRFFEKTFHSLQAYLGLSAHGGDPLLPSGQLLSDFNLCFARDTVTGHRVGLQALDDNIFTAALAGTINTVLHVFEGALYFSDPAAFSIANILR